MREPHLLKESGHLPTTHGRGRIYQDSKLACRKYLAHAVKNLLRRSGGK